MGADFVETRSQSSSVEVGGERIVFTATDVPSETVRVCIVRPGDIGEWCITPTREQAKHIGVRLLAFADTGTLEQ